jgi:hypothetical protein
VITPRGVSLFRVPDLAAFRATLTERIASTTPLAAGDTYIVVASRGAGEQLRRTAEARSLSHTGALAWPMLVTRRDLYDALAARLPSPPKLLSPFEREVLLSAVSRALIEQGVHLPYDLRPALVAEMLALYDQVRRLGRSVDDFERNFRTELAPEQDTDRGALRLLQQTTFLAAAYRAYESRLAAEQRTDEHGLRGILAQSTAVAAVERVIITVADRVADTDGLWPADFDLLTRLPGLQHIDVICTEAVLAAGFIERLYAAFPDMEDMRHRSAPRPPPLLITPPEQLAFTYRDREDELAAVARRLKQQRRESVTTPLHRCAIVVRRPLPYLYLARDVFTDAGIPFETLDTLPLAAEPFAAAVDLVLDAVAADFTRGSLLALLRSPHFDLGVNARAGTAISAADVALAEARFLGGVVRFRALVESWEKIGAASSGEERRRQAALPALRPLLDAVDAVRTLADPQLMTTQIGTLMGWLRHYDRPAGADHATRSRRLRVRSAVFSALTALAQAYERFDAAARGDVTTLAAAVRRWLGSQTFAAQTGEPGLQILDAQAARYADVDDLQVVGLIEGEWPERSRRNVLYPSSLLALLEPLPAVVDPYQRERDALQGARAAFRDLALSARERVCFSTFALENDAVVEPSTLLDDAAAWSLSRREMREAAARAL